MLELYEAVVVKKILQVVWMMVEGNDLEKVREKIRRKGNADCFG